MKRNLLLFTLLIAIVVMSCQPQTIEIYVATNGSVKYKGTKESPYGTIQDALSAFENIKKSNKNAKAVIHILEGEYRLSQPIEISEAVNGVTIKGEDSDKVIIKGSEKLDLSWKKYNENIFVTEIPSHFKLDQLYANGKQQILARYPNYNEEAGHWQGHAADAIDPDRTQHWKQPIGAIIHVMHSGVWGGFHYVVSGVKEDGSFELSAGHQNNRPSGMHAKYRMVENVFEELDSSGEWYLADDSKLYYWPSEGVNINTANFEGVQQKHLINIRGSEEKPAKNIIIKGIRFEHTKRTFLEDYEPLLRSDWTIYRGGAVFVEGAENVRIKDCEFVNLGGNAIFVSKYNRNISIEGNHIHECGASAISFVGDPDAVRSPSFQYGQFVPFEEMDTIRGPKNNLYPAQSKVDNNLIYRIGRLEKQTAGVQISMAMDITVSNNSIYDIPRAGINVSEGTWGGHIVEYNDVFNTVLETSDHGSFNSWGRDRFWHPNRKMLDQLVEKIPDMPKWDAIHTSIIRNNRFRCDHGWDIDLDDGSSNYKIYNNLCLSGGIKLREGFYRTVENNIMVNNGFHPHVWFKNSEDVFRKNIVLTSHKDIRLSDWGKEVDHNLFPDEKALKRAQGKGVDANSIYGDPMFIDPVNSNFQVKENSPAFKIGFKNFPMDQFGVKKASLKAIARTPIIPSLWSIEKENKSAKMNWLGAEIKGIETIEERSASGLNETVGVLILKISENSILAKSDIQVGDVIINCEGQAIHDIKDLLSEHKVNDWKGKLDLEIFRNQKSMKLRIITRN